VLALTLAALGAFVACSKKAPPAEDVAVWVVDPQVAVVAPGARPPFPAGAANDGAVAYWQIPTEHQDALREFAATLAVPAGRRVLVGPAARDGFSRTYVVEDPARVGRECVTAFERGEGEATVELSAACAARLGEGAPFVVAVSGKVLGPPGAALSGTKIVVETSTAQERN
jgi:hypothetical protein